MSTAERDRNGPRKPAERGLGRVVREERKRAQKRAERAAQGEAEIRGYYF